MELMQVRRQLLTADSVLPPIYKRIKYLESTGSQGIIFPFDFVVGVEYKLTCQASNRNDTGVLITSGIATASNWFGYAGGVYSVGGGTKLTNVTLTDVIDVNIEKTSTRITVSYDGETITRDGDFHADNRLCLFADVMRSSYFTHAKIFSLVADNVICLIPCIRANDGKPGMYDTVSKGFYTNAGTGEFVTPE